MLVATVGASHAGGVKLGKAKLTRGEKYIVDFDLSKVVSDPEVLGAGGIGDLNGLRFEACGDRPDGLPSPETELEKPKPAGNNLSITRATSWSRSTSSRTRSCGGRRT